MTKRLYILPFLGASLIMAMPADAKKKEEAVAAAPLASPLVTPDAVAADPSNRWTINLSTGEQVVIQLRPDVAPNTVYRIQQLTSQGFYNGLTFHRVIPGFMAQGGDPQGTGQGGSTLPDLKAEFNDLPHMRGVVAMARAESPDSANSQFYIMLAPLFKLDHKYTAFGRVIQGMASVDHIAVGEPPAAPTKILSATIGGPLPSPPASYATGVVVAAPVPAPAPAPASTDAPSPAQEQPTQQQPAQEQPAPQ